MALRLSFFPGILRGSITNERELVAYVISVTSICLALALAVDFTNQLVFFVDWATCLRSWAITAAVVIVLAIPISRAIAKAHLELSAAKAHADELSSTDQLTGLANRRALLQAACVADAGSTGLALAIVDIDRFKTVNDRHGHLAGDKVIEWVGRMMQAQLGQLGCVARIGGEEFALLSRGVPVESLIAKLMALQESVDSTPILVDGAAIWMTISAGVALRRECESFEQLYSRADQALYAAKNSGRDRICFFPAPESQGEREDLFVASDGESLLRRA